MSAVTTILKAIPIQVLSEMFEQLIVRLDECIANRREHVKIHISKLIDSLF
jgi:hypothetical protein